MQSSCAVAASPTASPSSSRRSPIISDDVEAVAAVVRSREGRLSTFVLGHSAGGVVAFLYTVEHQADIAGLICESFAFKVPAPDFALAVFKGLAHIAPHAHVLRSTLPLLILHGREDKATRPDGGFHDLLNDIDRARVMSDITTWIGARLAVSGNR